MFRILLASIVVVATGGFATAQKKEDPIPAPRPVPQPMPPAKLAEPMPPGKPMPPIVTPPTSAPSPGSMWSPNSPQKYPVPGQIVVVPGNAYGYLPARAVYGPAVSPNDFPYHAFVPGGPNSGNTYINPYPRTVTGR